MTKYFDWARMKDMDSRQKSEINTAATFPEQRKKKEVHRHRKEFGIKQMEEEVNIDWGKAVASESVYAGPSRAMQKLAAAQLKADLVNEEDDANDQPAEEET